MRLTFDPVCPEPGNHGPHEGQTVTFWPEYDQGSPWRWSRHFEGYRTREEAEAAIERLERLSGSGASMRPWRIAVETTSTTYLPYQRGRAVVGLDLERASLVQEIANATAVPSAVLVEGCHAGRDGECHWKECPQIADGEPEASGRHCPLDRLDDE